MSNIQTHLLIALIWLIVVIVSWWTYRSQWSVVSVIVDNTTVTFAIKNRPFLWDIPKRPTMEFHTLPKFGATIGGDHAIDNVRVYDHALTKGELQKLWLDSKL